jgi:hypothetical protein
MTTRNIIIQLLGQRQKLKQLSLCFIKDNMTLYGKRGEAIASRTFNFDIRWKRLVIVMYCIPGEPAHSTHWMGPRAGPDAVEKSKIQASARKILPVIQYETQTQY